MGAKRILSLGHRLGLLRNEGGFHGVILQLMRHSDMRLTTKIYTDASQLPTVGAIDMLPSLLEESTHQRTQSLGMDWPKGIDVVISLFAMGPQWKVPGSERIIEDRIRAVREGPFDGYQFYDSAVYSAENDLTLAVTNFSIVNFGSRW